MPNIKLDGREIPFEPGDTIIKAAWRQGVEIPHYCWHPGLSVAANCRMCLVEIEPMANRRQILLDVVHWDDGKQAYVGSRKPKLEPACQVECIDGMSIKSESSEPVAVARKNVQEFLLLNHPVDCPICDQAGECKLQDYWLENQRTGKRMRDEPVHKPKAVPFGDTIVYDAERCIVCTRCVRFMDEVAQDPVLDVRERGNLNEVVLAPGRRLEGHYTMMVDHVCPVGALTTKDFRFKARVWFLRKSTTVCPGCATGCNAWLDYDPRTGEVPRLRPRDNLAVNKFWMCDDGIRTHARVQDKRLVRAYLGRLENERTEVKPSVALQRAAGLLQAAAKTTAVVLSAQRSTEDNFALVEFARAMLGIDKFYVARKAGWDGDNILRDADQNPNVRGALTVAGGTAFDLSDLAEPVVAGSITTLLVLDGFGDVDAVTEGALGTPTIILLASNDGPLSDRADVILPIASWAEQDGTFINRQWLEQGFEAGPRPAGDALPGWDVVGRLAKALGRPPRWTKFRELRAAMKGQVNFPPGPHGHEMPAPAT